MALSTRPKLSTATRMVFHNIFCAWLVSAEDDELEQLDAVMEQSPCTEVRSMLTFIREHLEDPDRKKLLPSGLVESLAKKNWPQGESFGQVIAFPPRQT